MDSPSPKRRRVTQSQVQGDVDILSDSMHNVGTNESPHRATYTAPTRASIAKHNPGLLAGQDNLTTGDVRTEYATSSLRGPSRGLNPTALRPKMTAPRLSASPTRETSSSPSRRARPSHGALTGRVSSLRSANNQSTRTTQSENQEEADPQAEEDQERSLIEEEKLAASVIRRGKRGRAVQAGLLAGTNVQEAEPELPPTPVQLGLHGRPPPPVGVLSSSPGDKTPSRRALPKSSPLKPRPVPSESNTPDGRERAQDDNHNDQPSSKQIAQEAEIEDDQDAVEEDPEIVQRAQRLDQFQKQLQALRSEVSFLQAQVIQHQESPDQAISNGQLNRLVNILTTTSQSNQDELSPLKPTSLATRLSSFLPFAKRPNTVPQDPLLEEEILPSYKPIEGSKPLVHLQAFSGFSASSTQQLVVAETDGALLNQHDLTLTANGSVDLEINLMLLSDTDAESIEQLLLQSITPWADSELGTWIRKQAEDTSDAAVIGWGSSRYLDLARTRADCWRRCSAEYPQYMTDPIPSSGRLAGEVDDSDDEELAQFLGKVSLQLQSVVTRTTLQFSWHIDLDWIGDAESRVSAAATFPAKWRDRDNLRNSLSKIPQTFQLLVGKVGVLEAIKVLVGLILAPE